MSNIWKIEYHVIDPLGQAQSWHDEADKAKAIQEAQENGPGWSVDEVTSYLEDREKIWPLEDDDV